MDLALSCSICIPHEVIEAVKNLCIHIQFLNIYLYFLHQVMRLKQPIADNYVKKQRKRVKCCID